MRIQLQAVPTHIVIGRLGSGKTTLIKNILGQKPAHEIWAVVVNEFGQIGLDAELLKNDSGKSQAFVIKEIAGGCLCCSSQLGLQITLARLLKEVRPNRIIIEPTGLAHPKQLLELLTEPHWQATLQLQGIITVFDGRLAKEAHVVQQEHTQEQLSVADVWVVSHTDQLQWLDYEALQDVYQKYVRVSPENVHYVQNGQISIERLFVKRLVEHPILSTSITPSNVHTLQGVNTQLDAPQNEAMALWLQNPQGIFFYHRNNLQVSVGGWLASVTAYFNHDELLQWLLGLQNWLRIKGVVRTQKGWLAVNLTPQDMQIGSHTGAELNKLEMIFAQEPYWDVLNQQLTHMLVIG